MVSIPQPCRFLLPNGTETLPPLAAIILNRRTPRSNLNNLPFKWVEHCVVNHPACRVKRSSLHDALLGEMVPLPSRVIDVGPAEKSEDPRLLVTNKMEGIYLTLSHCWGTGYMTKTLNENLEARQKGIAMEDLSANLRDAVIITRKLGFRYLWIDSLCMLT
jgi:hypothetical protein